MVKIFVYGTLRKGVYNYERYLKGKDTYRYNGYIKGRVMNATETEIKGKYIKFTFYTENDVELGSEYVEIGALQPAETKTYEAKFRFSNVERFVATISDNKE